MIGRAAELDPTNPEIVNDVGFLLQVPLRTIDDATGEDRLYNFAPFWPGPFGNPTDNINVSADQNITVSRPGARALVNGECAMS